MKCPSCYSDTKVVDTRSTLYKKRRRRECINCKTRFTTYETMDNRANIVKKKALSKEEFRKLMEKG